VTACTSPACDGPGTVQGKFNTWCEDHAAILAEARKSMRRKSGPRPVKRVSAAERRAQVRDAAEKIAAAAREQPGRDDAAEVAGLGFESEAYQDALTRAKQQGWVVVRDHVCVFPGPVDPQAAKAPPERISATPAKPRVSRHERAVKLARAVHAAEGQWLSGLDAADAAGCARDGLTPVTQIAREAGWIVAQRGRPGYHAGPTPPPAG
jgi:hypothetical protein